VIATKHVVYIGDARVVLRDLCRQDLPTRPNLVVTSPPYAQGKEYERGMGYEDLWWLMRTVGTRCWEYCGSDLRRLPFFVVNFGETTKYDKERNTQAPDGSLDRTMAHLFTVTMKQAAWRIHSRRIWRKKFERIKAAAYNHTMTIPVAEFEHVWTWRRACGDREGHPQGNDHLQGVWDTSGLSEFAGKEHYPAPFPLEIPARAIRIWSREGDWVLDPFLGSGTTCLAAGGLGRNSIGIELYRDYRPDIEKKLAALSAGGHEVQIIEHETAQSLRRRS